MIATDEDALICDLAEIYQIYDYRALPPKTVATLCFGLSPDSRIKSKQAGLTVPLSTFLLAQEVDLLSMLVWFNTKDAEKGKNRPKPISDQFLRKQDIPDSGQFRSPDDFEAFRAQLLSAE